MRYEGRQKVIKFNREEAKKPHNPHLEWSDSLLSSNFSLNGHKSCLFRNSLERHGIFSPVHDSTEELFSFLLSRPCLSHLVVVF